MREEPLDLRLAQAGGRLVENEQPRLPRERARDGNLLLLRGAEFVKGARGISSSKCASRPLGFRVAAASECRPSDAAATARRAACSQRRISARSTPTLDGSSRCPRPSLGRRVEARRPSPPSDGACIRRVHAAEEFDKRRFARAVLADQGEHFAARVRDRSASAAPRRRISRAPPASTTCLLLRAAWSFLVGAFERISA